MKLHPGYGWHIFHILTSENIADVIPLFFPFILPIFFLFWNTHIYVIKRKLHVDLNIRSLSSCGIKISLVRCAQYFFPLENQLHMFAPPCNILYIIMWKSYRQSMPWYEYAYILGANWLITEWYPSRELVWSKGDACWIPFNKNLSVRVSYRVS